MENSFDYDLKDGRLEFQGQYIDSILDKGLDNAEQAARFNPKYKFELSRRKIERQELDDTQKFARGEIDVEALVVLSPIPDAVRYGGVNIGGYNKDRNKLLVRVVTKTDSGVNITSISLDQSNYQAMQSVAENLGYDLEDGLGSEEILAKRFWINIPVSSPKELISVIRESYDRSLQQQLGGEWYAGRRPIDVKDALGFIRDQKDLLGEHVRSVLEVKRSILSLTEKNTKLEKLRYNFAAALNKRMNGITFDSMASAGADAAASGENFDGDCPTASSASGSAASQSLEKSGLVRKVYGCCPMCKYDVWYDPCAPVCPRGRCPSNGYKPANEKKSIKPKSVDANKNKMSIAESARTPKPKAHKETTLRIGGKLVIEKTLIAVGGVKKYYVDKSTGEIVK